MGDLFSSFNPNTGLFHLRLPLNWFASVSVILCLPQIYWIIKRKVLKLNYIIINSLINELKIALGVIISPGARLFFLTTFFFIIFTNVIGLLPYVFTSRRHLSFTLAISLPVWLGYIVISLIKQFNINIAHLVPEGTPPLLIPLMVVIETVRLLIRPFTLAVRLGANIIAGHLLLTLLGRQGMNLKFSFLLILLIAIFALIALERAVACIQAYVFTILSTLYLNEHNSAILSK